MTSISGAFFIKSESKEPLPSEKFNDILNDLVSNAGLRERDADRYYEWFLDATQSSSIRENQFNFDQAITSHFESKGDSILERSCFYQKPVSKKQEQIDSIHYVCLRAFDMIFDLRDDPFTEWVDHLFDKNLLTAGQAILIPMLVSSSIYSLMHSDSDDSDLSELLKIKLQDLSIAEFSLSLDIQKQEFPLNDAEIVLFTEVFHALLKMRGVNKRSLFIDFLERFILSVKGYNAEIKSSYCDHLKSVYLAQLTGKESPTMKLEMKSVPKMRLEGIRYWLLRNFDETMKCRSSFAASIDKFRDEGFLTFSAANALLALEESPREWTVHNFRQNLLGIQERHHLDLDMEFLENAFFNRS